MEQTDKFRLYGLVPYNISPIQAGIQFGHALQEYNNQYYDNDPDFDDWRNNHKTFIILNGGTSSTMETHTQTLIENDIRIGTFREPDLNNMLSGIVFVVPEQVYKRKEYPDFIDWVITEVCVDKKDLLNKPRLQGKTLEEYYPEEYINWVNLMGGEKNVFLRKFTNQFKLY